MYNAGTGKKDKIPIGKDKYLVEIYREGWTVELSRRDLLYEHKGDKLT